MTSRILLPCNNNFAKLHSFKIVDAINIMQFYPLIFFFRFEFSNSSDIFALRRLSLIHTFKVILLTNSQLKSMFTGSKCFNFLSKGRILLVCFKDWSHFHSVKDDCTDTIQKFLLITVCWNNSFMNLYLQRSRPIKPWDILFNICNKSLLDYQVDITVILCNLIFQLINILLTIIAGLTSSLYYLQGTLNS